MTRFVFLPTTMFVVVLVQLLLLYAVAGNEDVKPSADCPEKSGKGICLSAKCVETAAEILNSLDDTVSACDDFYNFSCGKQWEKASFQLDMLELLTADLSTELEAMLNEPVPDSSREPFYVKTLKVFYESCQDVSTMELMKDSPLKKMLDSIGGWPLAIGENWRESHWLDLIIQLRGMGYKSNYLVSVGVTFDRQDSTKYILKIDQPSLGMEDKAYYENGLNDSVALAYFQLMLSSAIKLGAIEEMAIKETLEIFQFEATLANYSLPKEERRENGSVHDRYTVKQLEEMAPQIEWIKFLNGIMNDTIEEDETVVVPDLSFVRAFSKLISTTDKRVVVNYLVWRMVFESMEWLSEDWRQIQKKYSDALLGPSENEAPRWVHCMLQLEEALPVALSALYVRNDFKEESKFAAMKMFKYIRKEFLKILRNAHWMDETTKEKAIEKAHAMKSYIGFPKELLNDTIISDLYAGLNLDKRLYFENNLRLNKFSTDQGFQELRKPRIKDDWRIHSDAIKVGASYYSMENSIGLPAGVLQEKLFSKDRPQYMNFGRLGWFIGHEIIHGFDDKGRHFDKDGIKKNWWHEETAQLFKERTRCIIEQYGNYTDPVSGLKLNGIHTIGENVADNVGVMLAYKAYRTWVADNGQEQKLPGLKYSPLQLFWISAAQTWCGSYRPETMKQSILTDEHSPLRFRVIGSFSNSEDFARDFDCPLGSQMHPIRKCQVW